MAVAPFTCFVALDLDGSHTLAFGAGILQLTGGYAVIDSTNTKVSNGGNGDQYQVDLFPGDTFEVIRQRVEVSIINSGNSNIGTNPVTFVWLSGPREVLDLT